MVATRRQETGDDRTTGRLHPEGKSQVTTDWRHVAPGHKDSCDDRIRAACLETANLNACEHFAEQGTGQGPFNSGAPGMSEICVQRVDWKIGPMPMDRPAKDSLAQLSPLLNTGRGLMDLLSPRQPRTAASRKRAVG